MTDQTAVAANPSLPSSDTRGLVARIALAVLAIAAVLMPVMSVSSFGASNGIAAINGRFVGAASLLVPAAFIAALFVPMLAQTRPFARVADIAAFVVALCIGLYVAYTAYAGIAELAGMDRRMSSMMGGTGIQAPSISGMVDLAPGFGIAPWLILIVWSGWRSVSAARN